VLVVLATTNGAGVILPIRLIFGAEISISFKVTTSKSKYWVGVTKALPSTQLLLLTFQSPLASPSPFHTTVSAALMVA